MYTLILLQILELVWKQDENLPKYYYPSNFYAMLDFNNVVDASYIQVDHVSDLENL